jgi:hypothetical protein
MTMPKLVLALALALLAGCDKTAALDLTVAPEAVGLDLDLSCARSLEVIALASDDGDPPAFTCVSFEPGTFRSIDDHDLAGALDMKSPPSGAREVFLYVYDGVDCLGAPLLIGGGRLGGGGQISIPMAPIASCDQRLPSARTVRVIDFFGVAERKLCETPPAEPMLTGVLFGNRFDPYYPVDFIGAGRSQQPTAGTFTTTSGFDDALLSGCPAVANGVVDDTYTSVACVYADAPGACAVAGDRGPALELAHISAADAEPNLDPALTDAWLTAVIGVVVDANRNPIAGAQIQLRGDPAKVVYTRRTGKQLTPIAGTATDASGTFILYANQPVRVNVKVGTKVRALRVGGWFTGESTGSATVIVM